MKPILEISELSKKFKIHRNAQPYLSLRDSLLSFLKPSTKKEEFWALKDVSFDVMPGDTVGIIGRNGAGKSTLLKILSKITPPTAGSVRCRGRIASLLEVGTGFHSELSGRENIYMNGSILGMRRSEIQKNFDAIVDFSGVGKFIDTPLKHYSSGMQLRLAFAVAAFLENEILIIDEVLAVGDAEFQKKCLGKMENISRSGRTILFVSHNSVALKSLCQKGVMLEHGQVTATGGIGEMLSLYNSNGGEMDTAEVIFERSEANGNSLIRLVSLLAMPLQGDVISISSGIKFRLKFYNSSPGINLDATWELRNSEDLVIFHAGALISTNNDSKKGTYVVEFSFPPNLLNSDRYSINLIFGKNQSELLFKKENCYCFDIVNDVASGSNYTELPGVLRPDINFNLSYDPIG